MWAIKRRGRLLILNTSFCGVYELFYDVKGSTHEYFAQSDFMQSERVFPNHPFDYQFLPRRKMFNTRDFVLKWY